MASFGALPAQQIQLPSFAQAMANAQGIKASQQQSEFLKLRMGSMERQQERDVKARSLVGPTIQGDRQAGAELAGLDLGMARGVKEYQAADL